MKPILRSFLPFAFTLTGVSAELNVTATNPLPIERSAETIEITKDQLAALGNAPLNTLHVRDASGAEVLCQAVDTDGDPLREPDLLIFQADFGPRGVLAFTIAPGSKQVFSKDQYKAFGRFNRERFDDFAWENDRIAHRTYGAALETWEGEPLTSSTIDIWSKRTPRMVINDWYLADDYHEDHGEGADFYSAGPTRGCGGSGLWSSERLWTSRNFTGSRVLANGPIRVLFELEYEPWRVDGIAVSEVKRVSLDAGSQLSRFRSTFRQFTRPGQERELTVGIGLKKVPDETLATMPDQGWLAKWEAVAGRNGSQGLAVLMRPDRFSKQAEDDLNHLVLAGVPKEGSIDYWAGFAWDKAGAIGDFAAWQAHLSDFAARLAAPIEVRVGSR